MTEPTIRLTMAQALARFLASQGTEIDGEKVRLLGGGFAIFGHGNVAGLGGALVSGLFGYYAVVAAMRLGEVSVVAPFRYTRLVFAMVVAMIFLGERPQGSTLLGAAIVVGSGLYAFARARKRASPMA